MPHQFHHITLRVADLDRSRAFYQGVLGLTVDQDFPGEKLRLRLDATATRLVLKADPMGPTMLTFRDPDNIQWELFEQP